MNLWDRKRRPTCKPFTRRCILRPQSLFCRSVAATGIVCRSEYDHGVSPCWFGMLRMTKPITVERRSVIGALLVLIIQVTCPLSAARAACNHLVDSQSSTFAFNQLDLLIVGGSAALSQADLAQHHLASPAGERKRPCSGLSCSSGIPSLPLSTTSPRHTGSEQWGALNDPSAHGNTSRRHHAPFRPNQAPAIEQPAIFHPPRD